MQNRSEVTTSGPEAAGSRHMKLLSFFEGCLLLVRWLQLPLLIGLVVALVVFELKFVTHLLKIVSDMEALTRERAILVTLDLIDMVLIANLVVMVVISGYETFISRLHMDHEPSVPAWMRHSTTAQLKLRIATTILLISTIHLLHAYLDPVQTSDREAVFMMAAQVIFIATAAAFVMFDRLERRSTKTGGKP